MDMEIQKADTWDIFLWADGTHCYREDHERGGYGHMSDDFRVIPFESDEWFDVENS